MLEFELSRNLSMSNYCACDFSFFLGASHNNNYLQDVRCGF